MGQKGFNLIELLIVVATLGALAAVIIPNVGRFIGHGETEAKDTEVSNIQLAVHSMMVDNELDTLDNPISNIANRTNDMGNFPDTSTCGVDKVKDVYENNYSGFGDKDGYILFMHDRIADNSDNTSLANYVDVQTSEYWYTVDEEGTITQYDTAP